MDDEAGNKKAPKNLLDSAQQRKFSLFFRCLKHEREKKMFLKVDNKKGLIIMHEK